MCEKSAEIQGLWSPREGDYFLERVDETSPDDVTHGFYVEEYLRIIGSDDQANLCSTNIVNSYKQGNVWLPRQDQLQEMVMPNPFDSHITGVGGLARVFGFFCSPTTEEGDWIQPDASYVHQFFSMEQLWLAFVMEKKFKKVWNGSDWK